MSINLITPWSQILSIIYFLSVVNTQFSGLDKNIDGLEIMPTHINKYSTPKTFTEWYLNIDHLKNNFEARENYVR